MHDPEEKGGVRAVGMIGDHLPRGLDGARPAVAARPEVRVAVARDVGLPLAHLVPRDLAVAVVVELEDEMKIAHLYVPLAFVDGAAVRRGQRKVRVGLYLVFATLIVRRHRPIV